MHPRICLLLVVCIFLGFMSLEWQLQTRTSPDPFIQNLYEVQRDLLHARAGDIISIQEPSGEIQDMMVSYTPPSSQLLLTQHTAREDTSSRLNPLNLHQVRRITSITHRGDPGWEAQAAHFFLQ